MMHTEATAEVFWTAFKALSRKEQDAVVARLAQDKTLREDLIDIAIGYERLGGTTYPLEEVLRKIEGQKRRPVKKAGSNRMAEKRKVIKLLAKKSAKKKTAAKKSRAK